MPINISQFQQSFIEETIEMLDDMEKALLNFDKNQDKKEKINEIFRVAHSIKSGSAVFGFYVMNDFTHILEDLLEKIRADELKLNSSLIELLLKSVDCLRQMIIDIQQGREIQPKESQLLKEAFKKTINISLGSDFSIQAKPEFEMQRTKPPEVKSETETTETVLVQRPLENEEEVNITYAKDKTESPGEIYKSSKKTSGEDILENEFHIKFKPSLDFWSVKQEPFRMFSRLAEMGDIKVQADSSALPKFGEFDVELCYLAWDLFYKTNLEYEDVIEMFEWVTSKDNLILLSEKSDEVIKDNKIKKSISELEMESIKNAVPVFSQKEISEFDILKPNVFTIRVPTKKIDALVNIVGELLITQSILKELTENPNKKSLIEINEQMESLEIQCRELQENTMSLRMVPIGFAFNPLPRLAKELAAKLSKIVDLKITGEETEIDKNMMEKIVDPLVHLVRNSIDHGIEFPTIREAKGKPRAGVMLISAYQEGGCINIDVVDDGAGLDKEKIRAKAIANNIIKPEDVLDESDLFKLICHPGFSTAEEVTEISGRGVGLDVVLKNIQSIGGTLDIQSQASVGTFMHIILPLTLAIMDCQTVLVGTDVYAIPLVSITEIFAVNSEHINYLGENLEFCRFHEGYIPVIRLNNLFNKNQSRDDLRNKFIIAISVHTRLYGFVVDGVLSQQQLVIKNLEDHYHKIPGISGASILGDGTIALIIDPNGIIEIIKNSDKKSINSLPSNMGFENSSDEEEVNSLFDNTSKTIQILTFYLNNEIYGFNILEVKEILNWVFPRPLPNSPEYVKGIINLRGIIVPIIDLRILFQLEPVEYDNRASIIVLTLQDQDKERIFGIISDTVSDAIALQNTDPKMLQDYGQSKHLKYIKGIVSLNEKMITLINTKNLLPIERV